MQAAEEHNAKLVCEQNAVQVFLVTKASWCMYVPVIAEALQFLLPATAELMPPAAAFGSMTLAVIWWVRSAIRL
jgi:hypothetical protein